MLANITRKRRLPPLLGHLKKSELSKNKDLQQLALGAFVILISPECEVEFFPGNFLEFCSEEYNRGAECRT